MTCDKSLFRSQLIIVEIDLFWPIGEGYTVKTHQTLLKYHVSFFQSADMLDSLFLSQIIIVEMITEIYFYIYCILKIVII